MGEGCIEWSGQGSAEERWNAELADWLNKRGEEGRRVISVGSYFRYWRNMREEIGTMHEVWRKCMYGVLHFDFLETKKAFLKMKAYRRDEPEEDVESRQKLILTLTLTLIGGRCGIETESEEESCTNVHESRADEGLG